MAEPTIQNAEQTGQTENNLDGLLAKRDELLGEVKKLKEKHSSVYEENEILKEKIAKIEDEKAAFEKKKAEEQGKFKDLYSQSEAEKKSLAEKQAELEGKVKAFEEREEKRRLSVLDKFYTEWQIADEEKNIYSSMTVEQLTALMSKKPQNKNSSLAPPQPPTSGNNIDLNNKGELDKAIIKALFS